MTDQEVPSSSSTQMITPEHQDGQDEGEVTVSLMVLFFVTFPDHPLLEKLCVKLITEGGGKNCPKRDCVRHNH